MPDSKKRTSISLDSEVMADAQDRMKNLDYETFSDYIAFLIAHDVQEQAVHTVVRGTGGPTYKTDTAPVRPPKKN